MKNNFVFKKISKFLFDNRNKVWLLLLIYLLTVSIRLYQLGSASIYADEITWIVRGKELIYALIQRNVNYLTNGWWNDPIMTEAIALPLTFFNGLFLVAFAGAGKYSLKIFSDMFASRLPVVLISSLIPVGIYHYGSSIFSKKLSLIAAFVYIFNPISIALDREVVNDSFLTLFTFFALISYVYYSRKKVINIIPGIFLSLAFLTKPDGILPILGWLFFIIFVDRSKYAVKYFLVNIFSFLLIVTIFWPPSWRIPVFAIFEYLYRQLTLVQAGMGVFYKGVVTDNPGFDFYIFQYLVRMPVALILGFIVSILIALRSVFKKAISIKPTVIPIVLYNLTFFLLISFSSKKLGIRYAEPLLPWFVILSSWGLIWLFESIHNCYFKTTAILIIAINILAPLSYNPDYYFYYNFLVGGPKGAQRYDMVGFCSSTRLATNYLEERNMTGSVFVAGCPDPVRYYWSGLDITYNYQKADYIILETYYVNQHPEDPVLAYLADKTSVKDIQFHRAIIARIYKQN